MKRNMYHSNNILFLVLALSITAEAVKDLAPAPEPSGSPSAKSSGKGGLECMNFIDKITSSKETVDPLAKQICGRSQSPAICQKTVMETNAKSEPLNSKSVVLLQLEALAKDIKLAIKDCEGSKDKVHEFCGGSYKKADEELGNAVNVSKGDDLKAAVGLIQGAMKHVATCQQELENEKSKSQLKEVNDFLTKLADNCVSVADAIITGTIKRRR